MVAVGFGVLWFAYAVGIYGYCLVRGYAVGFGDLFHLSGGWPSPTNKNENTTGGSTGGKTGNTTPGGTGTLGKGVS